MRRLIEMSISSKLYFVFVIFFYFFFFGGGGGGINVSIAAHDFELKTDPHVIN